MLISDPKSILKKLSPVALKGLEAAISTCTSLRHYSITPEHLIAGLLECNDSDFAILSSNLGVSKDSFLRNLSGEKSGNTQKPTYTKELLILLQDALVHSSTELGESCIRSASIFARIATCQKRYLIQEVDSLYSLPSTDELKKVISYVSSQSPENSKRQSIAPKSPVKQSRETLDKYCIDLTKKAKDGLLDPVFCRETEIRQIVDILVRRRKNNPLIIGESGVGKTALVEGLAIRIAEGTVPKQIANSTIYSLDLGALQAGAGIKGEFESRLKGVLSEIAASVEPIILFIDEAHTIIGAGGQGAGDAANLLKPALSRGELRTIAATTFSEYKKNFEKDAALDRRFQSVRVDEPSVDQCIQMMRGVVHKFEKAHDLIILDEAIEAASKLSSRYISGRQLPDKAIDLIDTAAARVKVMRAALPPKIENIKAELQAISKHIKAINSDIKSGFSPEDQFIVETLESKSKTLEASLIQEEEKYNYQKSIVERIHKARKGSGDSDSLEQALSDLRAIPPDERMVYADVDASVIASIISDWTGIPVGKMVKDDISSILSLEARMGKRVRGQEPALKAIAKELKAAKAGLKPSTAPLGVFLLVGPSGTGKTETALTIADLMFGGERFMTTINMSEYQEKHTVSRLLGSPAGYVGYGEGGVLTEAVRHRPYSVVLLDEVEKADKDVLNLFYQVFDKGMLADGEGRVIDFKNTVIILTSNLATDILTDAAPPSNEGIPSMEELINMVKPTLTAHFKPALLARMSIVPFVPIRQAAMESIVKMKLGSLIARAQEAHSLTITVDDQVYTEIANQCQDVQSGARNIDHILRGTIMPMLSDEILQAMTEGLEKYIMNICIVDGNISCTRVEDVQQAS